MWPSVSDSSEGRLSQSKEIMIATTHLLGEASHLSKFYATIRTLLGVIEVADAVLHVAIVEDRKTRWDRGVSQSLCSL